MSVKLKKDDGTDIPLTIWQFPCGEVGVKPENGLFLRDDDLVVIMWDWESNEELMIVAQIVDIIRNDSAMTKLGLFIPYFPYSRQDRRCNKGEAHSLKVFASIINNMKFEKVITIDPHSYVLEAVVDNLMVITQADCTLRLPSFDVFIAPDAGAEKKIYQHSQVKDGEVRVICASKTRDSMGKITRTTLEADPSEIEGKNVCIVDDLCDGGATFLTLGSIVKDMKPATLNLYVTHGMFTKGYEDLMAVFDKIYVSNLSPIAPKIPDEYNRRIISYKGGYEGYNTEGE